MIRAAGLPRIGDVIADKYRILRVVADGGMGVVLEAHHERLGKSVALKFLLPELAQIPSVVERFAAEARLCARIEDEHVPRILDVAEWEGQPYLVMEFVRGTSLSELLGTRWPAPKAAAFAAQLSEALQVVHAAGVVHRDIKPDNVIVVATARGPLLKLLDFGIAKDAAQTEDARRLTHAGAFLGTPAYMSPEQIRDPLHVGFASDVYAVGVLLFEMLAGTSPFVGGATAELVLQILAGQVRSLTDLAPGTPAALGAIVTRAMALEPAARFTSAAELTHAVNTFSNAPGRTELVPAYELATKTVLADAPRIRVATPVLAPALGVWPAPRAQPRRWLVPALVLGALGVAGLAFAFAEHRSSPSSGDAVPSALPSAAPETDIAPLDSAAPEASLDAGRAAAPAREIQSPAPRAPTPSVPRAPAPPLPTSRELPTPDPNSAEPGSEPSPEPWRERPRVRRRHQREPE